MRRILGLLVAVLAVLGAPAAWATFHTYQIDEIFSNADGTVQYVVLREVFGSNGENFWAGHTFTSTSGSSTQTYVFDKDLPGGMDTGYGMTAAPTAFTRVLVATQGFAALGLVTPDYVVPNGFLPLANGTINYAGVDQVSYASLPTDGVTAIKRNGAMVQNVAANYAGTSGSVAAGPPPNPLVATAVEYYYADWNFYFETAFPDEIAALDGGAFGGVWKRTGQTFNVWTQATGAAAPTCRFFSTIFDPKSSHFYTPFDSECASLKAGNAWQFEGIAFYIDLPDANGLCPAGTVPLYRLYDNGMGGAPNHRYTTSLTVFNQQEAAGWSFEGNGDTKVFACVPA
ncbi:MAG TPA: hypothetical protein VFF44_13985 [Casimicrobiaceae bacterium]|nr:hypothetical protein [Casimicrobiaceae bacterium]